MKHLYYGSMLAILFCFGSCNQKKLAQQKDLAEKAKIEAEQQRDLAEKARIVALANEKNARYALTQAKRAEKEANMSRQQAILAKKKCEEANARLHKKLEELKKK